MSRFTCGESNLYGNKLNSKSIGIGSQQLEVPHSLFLLYAQVDDCQDNLKLSCSSLAFT